MNSPSVRVFNRPGVGYGDIVEEGTYLYRYFLREEIYHADIEGKMVSNLESLYIETNCKWTKYGIELRKIADTFSKTKEKESLNLKAQQVSFADLTYHDFCHHLIEMFCATSYSNQRIVNVFLFSSEVAINALKIFKIDKFYNIVNWTLDFIRESICSWVCTYGGWPAVIHDGAVSIPFDLIIASSLGLIILLAIHFFKYHHNS